MRRRDLLRLAGTSLLMPVASPARATDRGFPVTVRHMHGETHVPARPERVVCLGLNDHDFTYALGIAPVGVTEWWGNRPFATWPWAEPLRQSLGAAPQVGGSRFLDFEWILSLEPELILATYRDLDARSYARLSRIAPVIAAPSGYPIWTAPWQAQLALIGEALGQAGKARAIAEGLGQRIEAVRAALPQLAGKTAALADFRDGQFVLWSDSTAPTRFLTGLGLVVPPALAALANPAGWIYLSLEQAELLDLDLLIWPNDVRRAVEKIALFRTLPVYAGGRCLWLSEWDPALSAALWFQSPLSIAYLLDRLPSRMAALVR